ncbi:DUF4124 domain-containing protein [Dyella choica]|uniref:DUF4124 domain-containing protein n=1 Tax=Dyella choica TaxID=1927959 RepID=A0A3S0R0V2_9GAMM|nr:DUF4124 domain-containing protein [Dyella choica]RUL70275.1 DUF4124 domain-containing protein [Dyella choica]
MILATALSIALQPFAQVRADSVTVYKCRTPQGELVYQGTPCLRGQQQQTLQLDDSSPRSAPLPEPAKSPPPAASTPAAPLPAPVPRTPPSAMYRCARATDQTTYLSSNGDPQPYYAPLAMTGMLPTPLGHITPGVKPNAAMVSSQYVLVQDQCAPMTPQDTCSTLRDQYDENERKLSRAFKSDQPPLLQREQALLAELSHC